MWILSCFRYYEQGYIDGLRYLAKLSKKHSGMFDLPSGSINLRTRDVLLNDVARRKLKPRRSTTSTKSKISKKSGSKETTDKTSNKPSKGWNNLYLFFHWCFQMSCYLWFILLVVPLSATLHCLRDGNKIFLIIIQIYHIAK